MPDPRRETECVFKCPTCGGTPYRMLRTQVVKLDGAIGDAWRHQLACAPGVDPPIDPHRLVCQLDGAALIRVAA